MSQTSQHPLIAHSLGEIGLWSPAVGGLFDEAEA